jgi:hypothetical protein
VARSMTESLEGSHLQLVGEQPRLLMRISDVHAIGSVPASARASEIRIVPPTLNGSIIIAVVLLVPVVEG